MHSWQTPKVETLLPMQPSQLVASALGPVPSGHYRPSQFNKYARNTVFNRYEEEKSWICGFSYKRAAYAVLSDGQAWAVLAAERVVCVAARAAEVARVLLAAALHDLVFQNLRVDGDRLAAPQ